MQLLRLVIKQFRNLRDVELVFNTHLSPSASTAADGPPKPIRSHALIGQNGTGKSNLIEALITIFRDVDLNQEASLDYVLEYTIRGHHIRIEADRAKQKRPFVWVDGEQKSQDYLTQNDPPDKIPRDERRGPRLLPTHIFAYYSGRNERIESLFQEHQRRFNRRQEITTDEVLSKHLLENFTATEAGILAVEEAKRRREARLKQAGDDRLRRLFYCRGGHSQLVLLACLLSDDPVFQKVLANLHIESLESALFVLKEPHRLREKRRSGKFDEAELNEGDPRFWYARGNVVNEFLDKLWQVAWAPIEQEATKQIDFRGRTEKQKQLYLFVPSQDKLRQLGELVGGTDSFFRYAEGAYIGDLIDEVRITVKKRDEHGGKVSFTQLSEGELQILTVLGLMRITREDHCLFLLDEPDTHLNPIWKLRYFDDIEGVLASEQNTLQGESQILITTHDPMMVGGLKREQVHILRRENNQTIVDIPDEHPQGMGVTGLLKSELFGLASTLDSETERRLFRRNELFVQASRSAEEEAELSRLSAELADLGFSTADFRDPDYALFVRKMAQHRKFRKPTLSPQEQAEQGSNCRFDYRRDFARRERSMIFIDLEHKLPTDFDLPGNIRWQQADWDEWLAESARLLTKLAQLDAVGKIEDRNRLIDKNSGHWGKLKPWLLSLSDGKCWFTEARDIASHLDVEHFRPKKAARNIKGPERDGYWWLAFDFMNFRIAGTVPNRKKGAWFPLRYGSVRSSFSRRCEGDEIPHFLDPTNAHDVTLLAFDEEGKAIPAPGISLWDHVRVRRTVERLKLTEHQALAEERRKVWQKVTMHIRNYKQALSESRYSATARVRAKASAREIAELTKSGSELSSVAKWCVLLQNDRQLARLVS